MSLSDGLKVYVNININMIPHNVTAGRWKMCAVLYKPRCMYKQCISE
jgi:hypothetical protein